MLFEAVQLSDTAGAVKTTVAEQVAPAFTVIEAGAAITGDTLSVTVTVCVAVAVLPLVSVTVQVTVVSPIGNKLGALFVTEATVQLSAAVGFPNATLNA
jgi:hypothetical protein